MIQIAIVEDNKTTIEEIRRYLRQYEEHSNVKFQITAFDNAVSFLDPYTGYDIIFMDIKMPYMDGMEAAMRLRKVDSLAILIFVTNMVQYAVRGYEADALDFILKPVKYYNFAMKLEKALNICRRRCNARFSVKSGKKLYVLEPSAIHYIEVINHDLIFHTENGELESKESLNRIEKQLKSYGFARCNISYLVNLASVTAVEGDDVIVGNNRLHMTRSKKKQFLKQLTDYLGGW